MDYLAASHSFGVLERRSRAFIDSRCAYFQLSYSEFITLSLLFDLDGCSQEELVSTLAVDKSLVARLIKELERKGYVYRKRSVDDRRYKFISLTEKGHSMKGTFHAIIEEWLHIVCKGLPKEAIEETFRTMSIAAKNAAAYTVDTQEK